jgi:hypothetical protein
MTRDDIIRMADEAGLQPYYDAQQGAIERFAALVAEHARNRTWTQEHWTEYERSIAAAEREACADIVENADTPDCGGWTTDGIAAAIRARSNS